MRVVPPLPLHLESLPCPRLRERSRAFPRRSAGPLIQESGDSSGRTPQGNGGFPSRLGRARRSSPTRRPPGLLAPPRLPTAPAGERGPPASARRNEGSGAPPLVPDLRLDELREERERLLPTEIAGLHRNHARNALLHDVQLGSARDLLQGHRRLHLAPELRV